MRIKREAGAEKPTVWIGKGGAAPRIMDEVSRQLDQKGTVKVKILKSALKDEEAENMAVKIAQKTNASLIDVRGHTFVLHKPKKSKS